MYVHAHNVGVFLYAAMGFVQVHGVSLVYARVYICARELARVCVCVKQ